MPPGILTPGFSAASFSLRAGSTGARREWASFQTGFSGTIDISRSGDRRAALSDIVYMFEEMRRVVAKIPKGKVATYGAVAEAAGFPGNARRVAWALSGSDGKLPWHRVLGTGGKILLPGAAGMEQRMRLEAEGVAFRGARVRMEDHEFRFRKRQ